MAERRYVGARYVPLIMGAWDNSIDYEPLSIVTYNGASYTSRQFVPVGTPITDNEYWALTGDYDAQVATVQNDVDAINDALPIADFSSASTVKDAIDSVASNMSDLADLLPATDYSAASTVKDAIDSIADLLPASDYSAASTVKDAIDSLADLLPASDFDSVNTVKDTIDAINARLDTYNIAVIFIGDSYISGSSNEQWVPTFPQDIADDLGWTIETYAKAGAGWVHAADGITFNTLVSNCVTNTGIDESDYEKVCIFIYGGLNDFTTSENAATVKTNAATGIAALRTKFPHAEIHLCGINLARSSFGNRAGYYPYFLAWQEAAQAADHFVFFHDARGWLASDDHTYGNDTVHPVGSHANKILKNKFVSLVYGKEWKYTAIGYGGTIASTTINTNDWLSDAFATKATISCCEGEYCIQFYQTTFTDFTNELASATTANIGRMYRHSTVTMNEVFTPASTHNALTHECKGLFRNTQDLCFEPLAFFMGRTVYLWIKIRNASNSSVTIDADSWWGGCDTWSIL